MRGANVSPGYWRGPGSEAVREPLGEGGWLRTGDLGEVDAAGNIYFRGRKKDVIVTAAGLNVYPEDIEAALNHQPEVKLSAVVGVEGPRGPEPLAVLIMHEVGADPAAVVERVNESLARHQHVRRWQVWPDADFPRTPTQKVRKRDILERLGPGLAQQNGHTNGNTLNASLSSLIASLAARAGGGAGATLAPSASLSTDLKLDSLGRVELMSALEDRYQIEIDEASFTAATTVADVERIVNEGGGLSEESAQYPYPAWTQAAPVRWLRVAIFYAVVLPVTSVLCWSRVRGRDNLKNLRGPALFVSNHITYFDHALIMSAMPGRFRRRLAIAQEGERLRWWRKPRRFSAPRTRDQQSTDVTGSTTA